MNAEARDELAARMRWTLARIGELINEARAVGWAAGEPIDTVDAPDDLLSSTAGDSTPMQYVARRLGLLPHEQDALWLLSCVELDPALSAASQHLVSAGMNELSAQMLERLVAGRGLLDEEALERLHSLALIETTFDPRVPIYRRSVRVHDAVLQWARGRISLDRSLRSFCALSTALDVRRETAAFDLEIPSSIHRALSHDAIVVATGVVGSGRSTVLRHAASSRGQGVLSVRAEALPTDENALVRVLRIIARECRIHDACPQLLEMDRASDRIGVIAQELFERIELPVLATARETSAWPIARTIVNLPVELPNVRRRQAMWQRALPTASSVVVDACAHKYLVPPGVIARSAAAATSVAGSDDVIDESVVHRALRTHLERQLSGIARRIETTQTWDDLVLPIDQFDLLIEMVARVRHKDRVLEDWGFAEKVGRGLGLSALFSGPPGTGKTMVAGLIARELGLDLYQVDLSKVVSKYIGETEKQLSALFEAAESGHAILLFDEADSLFAKRTEVKSSNDRYANLEVNYLLQRLESFSGITILTTNHETAIDQAFLRRLAFHVRVPMPEEQQRELLWRSMMPAKAVCADDIDYAGLARSFEMSGGYIRNAALRAAFLTAEEGGELSNEQLWRAARSEYEAMGKIAYAPSQVLG